MNIFAKALKMGVSNSFCLTLTQYPGTTFFYIYIIANVQGCWLLTDARQTIYSIYMETKIFLF